MAKRPAATLDHTGTGAGEGAGEMDELARLKARLAEFDKQDAARKAKGAQLKEARDKKRAERGEAPTGTGGTRAPRAAAPGKTLESIRAAHAERLSAGDVEHLAHRVRQLELLGVERGDAVTEVMDQYAQAVVGVLEELDHIGGSSVRQAVAVWVHEHAPKTIGLRKLAVKSTATPTNETEQSGGTGPEDEDEDEDAGVPNDEDAGMPEEGEEEEEGALVE